MSMDVKYTVIYNVPVGFGSNVLYVTKMKRFTQMEGETIGQCFDALDIYDPIFLFEGWPLLEGEIPAPNGEACIQPMLTFPCKNLG